jgi:hypothetical protein
MMYGATVLVVPARQKLNSHGSMSLSTRLKITNINLITYYFHTKTAKISPCLPFFM